MNPTAINFLDVLFDSDIPDRGNVLFDRAGSIIKVNFSRFGITATAGDSVWSIFAKHAISFPLEDIVEQLKTTSSIKFELSSKNQNSNQSYQFEVYKFDIDNIVHYLAMIVDTSEQKNRDHKLKSLSSNLDNELKLRTREIVMTQQVMGAQDGGFLMNFLRGLRHDLNSPLAQLKGLISFFNRTDDPQKKQRIQEHISSSMAKFDQTLNSLNAFINLYFLPNRDTEKIKLEDIFKVNMEQLREQYPDKEIEISSNFEAVDHIIYNKNLLQSIFHNILSNAFKFSAQDRNLKLKIWSETFEDGVKLFFQDNGSGMNLVRFGHHLFAPFKRLNHQHPGAGMGLSLIKNSLDRFGDNIEVNSEIDKGTTVTVSLKNQAQTDPV